MIGGLLAGLGWALAFIVKYQIHAVLTIGVLGGKLLSYTLIDSYLPSVKDCINTILSLWLKIGRPVVFLGTLSRFILERLIK